ncbi:MAG: Ig-like domain-containing protein [Mangrovimonas sp.]|nr:Ig-like domain-containing protein [Mangrovimonas sp.]
MRNLLLRFLGVFLIIASIISCANRGSPQGGPKDMDPPKIERSSPDNYSINFTGKEIKIYFDEYIKLKNLNKQLIISPPMNTQPEITPLGSASKYITIKIFDTLQPNTTYAFNFGNSIVDNNEENAFPFYRYVFSTGNYIDSLQLKGSVRDALESKTDEFVSVMLYEKDTAYTDSVVYKKLPKYITNTLDSVTSFTLENLKPGTYKLVALKDGNQDNKYQQRSDKIGFKEGFVTIPNDSSFNLRLFKEVPDFKVIRPHLLAGEKIAFGYQGDYKGTDIEVTSIVPDTFAYRITKEPTTDSLLYWYKPRLDVDSLLFHVKHPSGYEGDFTVRISEQKRDSLKISTTPTGNINFEENLTITSQVPFERFDDSKVTILDKDSLQVAFTYQLDTLNNKYLLSFNKKEEDLYKIQMLPGTFTDFFGNKNDTLNYSLKTKTVNDYGNVRIHLINAVYPVIVQLTTEKGDVKYEQYVTSDKPVDFFNLSAGQFNVRVVFDANKNGIYDSGNFLKGIQPERVSYFSEVIEVRTGFDNVYDFTLLD